MLNLTPATVAADSPLQVVVYREGNRSLGLVVDRIADIVETDVPAQGRAASDGLFAPVVIQNKVTELLDLAAVIRRGSLSAAHQPLAV